MKINLKSEAIIGTIIVHLVLILIMNIFVLSSKVEKKNEGVLFEIDFEQLNKIEQLSTENTEQSNAKANSNQATNTASDFEERKPDYKSFEERATQELNQEIKAIEESVRGEKNETTDENSLIPNESPEINEPKFTTKTEEQKPSEYKGKTNISYALENRYDTKLKVPVYMCEGSGTIVVNIDVDKYGFVKTAKVDKKNSANSFCLQKAAEMAAKKSRFNSSESNPESQKGTITYIFVPQ